jgi:predicted small secreted protein
MRNHIVISLLAVSAASLASCTKTIGTGNDPDQNGSYILSYGDSILHLKTTGDNIVRPTSQRQGTYSGFPEGIEIDAVTGAININESETGLRYRITHTAPNGTVTETKVVLAGITFKDHIYYLSANDSIAHPVYNADINRVLPIAGSSFDEGNIANGGGCSVKTDNGKINLKETIRNGVFRLPPRNDEQQTFEIKYRINDASGKSLNKLKVLLYWYNTVNDIPQYVWDILNERVTQGVFLRGGTGAALEQVAKPRPPCVVIVDH